MNPRNKEHMVIFFYVATLGLLLLCVLAVPLSIQWGWPVTKDVILGEEILETLLIAVLLAIFFLTLNRFKRARTRYHLKYRHEHEENSKLMARVADASEYIGKVNVELQEISTIIDGLDQYPKTKNDLKQTIAFLATRAMIIAKAPWILIRIIDAQQGRILTEHRLARTGFNFPQVTIGNRQLLEDTPVPGLMKRFHRKKNAGLMTVCIMPETPCSDEEKILIKMILGQIEIYFLLCDRDLFSDFLTHTKGEDR